jgi:AP-3 complex subunit beta
MHPSNFAHWSLSTARDLTLEAARDASNVRRAPTKELPSGQLKKLLDSRAERDVLEGLRRVVTVGLPHHLGHLGRDGTLGTCSN